MKLRPILVFLILTLTFGLTHQAFAYPNFMSFGYQSCLECHYNPMGGGPLTDYGRVVSATLISDRVLWNKDKTDEQLEEQSGFEFAPPANTWLRPQLNYRGMEMQTDPGKPDQKSQFITMEASAALVLKFLPKDKLTFVGDLGYAPNPLEAASSVQTFKNYRSREIYVGYRWKPELGFYAGLMDKAFGIRIPDHEAFSRSVTNLNQDDQTYGVMAHYLKDKWEIALQPFLGNFVQDSSLRQKGVTTQVGYNLDETTRLGASVLRSSSTDMDMLMYSVDGRISAGKGYSLLGELGQVEKSLLGSSKVVSRYLLMQNHFLLHPGLYTILTVEMLQNDIQDSSQTFRFGPGIQYFMTDRVEWRADIYDARSYQSSSDSPDNWTITAQMHLWF